MKFSEILKNDISSGTLAKNSSVKPAQDTSNGRKKFSDMLKSDIELGKIGSGVNTSEPKTPNKAVTVPEVTQAPEKSATPVDKNAEMLSYNLINGAADIEKLSGDVSRMESLSKDIASAEKWLADYEEKSARNTDYRYRYKHRYDALTERLAGLNAEYGEISSAYGGAGTSELNEKLRDSRLYHHNAERYQNLDKYTRGALDAEDFAEKSGYVSTKVDLNDPDLDVWSYEFNPETSGGYTDLEYEYINKTPGIEDVIRGDIFGDKGYEHMTPEQVAVFNYYYTTEGRKKAMEYLDLISDELTTKLAAEKAKVYNNTWREPIYNADAATKDAVVNMTQGISNLVTGSYDPVKRSAESKASELARRDNTGLGKLINDAAYTTGYMAPSIGASILSNAILPGSGAVIGAGVVGASSAGGAYDEMIQLGYSANQARAYGVLVGASEASLQYLLGGISKLGGKATGKLATGLSTKLDDVLAKVAINHPALVSGIKTAAKLGVNVAGEITEEELQLILEPLIKTWVTGEAYLAPDFEEMAYTAIVTALSTAAMEGPSTVAGGFIDDGGAGSAKVPKLAPEMPKVQTETDNIPIVPGSPADTAQQAKDFSQYAQGVFEDMENDTYEPELMEDPEIADAVSDMDVGEGDTFTPSDGVIQARDVHEDFRNTGKFIPDTPTQEFRKAEAAKATNDIQRSGILAGASKADIRTAEVMSALTGRNVIFESEDYRINGHFDGNNTIFVNASRKDGIFAQVLAHELTHSVEKTKAYKGLVKAARSFVEANTYTDDAGVVHDWDYYAAEAHAEQDVMYPKLTGQAFTDEKADAEVVAKVLEGFFADNTADAARNQVALDTWLAEAVKTNKNAVTRMWYKLSQMAKRIRSDIKDIRARKADGYDAAARERELMLRRIEDIRDRFGRALMEAKKAAKSGNSAFSFVGTNKKGVREYISDFPENMSQDERVEEFKNRIRSVIDLGQVQLKTDTKKFVVVADKFTRSKNTKGDTVSSPEAYDAKINSLYDMADILNSSKFDYKQEEPSYDSSTNSQREGVEPKNKAHKDVKYWYYFTNTIKLDGIEYDVVFNIRDKGKKQALYFVEFRNKETVSGNNPTAKYSLRSAVRQTPSDSSISHSESKVNTSGESFSYTPDSDYIGTMAINDAEYMAAVERGDIETVQRMVEEAARANGYNSPKLYHGTQAFGFTKVDVSESDDGISFFATDSLEVAQTYSGKDEVRGIAEESTFDYDDLTESNEYVSALKVIHNYNEETDYETAKKAIWDSIEGIVSKANSALGIYNFFDIDEAYDKAMNIVDQLDMYGADAAERALENYVVDRIDSVLYERLGQDSGNYALYANTDNFLEVDAEGGRWNQIDLTPPEIIPKLEELKRLEDEHYQLARKVRSYANEHGVTTSEAQDRVKGYWELEDKITEVQEEVDNFFADNKLAGDLTTREIASYAKDNGYAGVKISNVYDDGGRGRWDQLNPATVYIFFNPEAQTKSADPVTYDDKGNVIPLSERFDTANGDIRFSYNPDSDYIGTMPINDAEAANRKRALEMYRQLDAGKDIGNGNMDPAEYIYMQTGWAYNNLGNFVVDHEAPIYLDNRTQHQMANRRADHTEGVNNALRSENAGLREGLERAVSVARDAYGMKSSDYTSTTKAARDIIGRITDMFGGGYTKKQANGFIKKLLSIYDKRSEVDSYGVRAVPEEQISSELGALVAEMQDIGIEDDERRELQKRLKAELKVPVYLSEKARGDFSGGYGKMAKDYRGRVNFTTKDRGVPVDVRYEELTGIFPDMFPADIVSEADQAAKILEISDMIRDEEFVTESRYMFSGGEAQSRADAVDAARVIFEGFRQMDAMPKTEADRYAREAEKARRAADEVRKNSAEQIARETERIRAEERRRADEEAEWIKFYEDRDNARMTAEYREGLQRAEERVDQISENYRQATDEMANEYREALDKQAEDAAKAYQKERIKRTFNRIKKLYDNPTKNHNIKESERDFVKSALDLMESIFASGVTPRTMVNLDYSYATETEQKNLDHLRGLYDRLSDLEAKTKDQKVIAPETSAVMDDLKEEIHRYETRLSELFTRKRNELQGMTVTRLMSDFAAEYGKLRDAEEGYISDAYDPAVHERISNMASNRELSGKTVRKLTSSELESIYEVFASAVNVVYRTNNMFNDRKGATLMENVTDTITELNDVNASRPTGKINRFIDKHFKWANFKPAYAMRYLGSKTMSRLYDNLRKGEDVYAKDIDEARTFYEGEVEKYNADDWNLKEKHTFSTESGQRFELTLDQMMSVYAYSKRDQAALHFSDGGIIPKSKTDKIWGKAKHKAEKASPGNIDAVINSIVGDATAYKLTGKALDTVIDSLTAEQKKFVDDLQNYMSNELSAKGNEVSRAMYGIDLFKEKFYMPLKSATQYMKVRYEEGKGDVRIKNKGMTKETVSGANNPVVVEGFTDVWANHVNEMSLYHAMVLPMEDFSKVFGYAGGITEQRADANVKHDNISVRAVIENLYGENATKYIDKLIRDINGGIKADTEGALDAMISKSKKASVLASLSVVIQQPTAGIRAMAYIDPKYFVGKKAGKSAEKSWVECKKYAPVAVIKEMGRFDTGTGVNTSKYITNDKSVLELADDLAGWGASKADEVTWSSIWEACKREAADKNKALKTNDAICRAAAQRFTEVVSLTQVYDSVFSRSETMRSKNQLHQMATSFMSEPVTVANMVYDAFVQAKRGDKQILGRVISAVVVSTLVNNALKSIIYAMRDDDEDETYLEKYLGSLASNTLDSMNPLTYVPYVRDVWSLFQGYDVERMDVALIQNLVDAIVYAAGPKGSTLKKIERLAGVVGDVFGIPVKNLLRDMRGIYNGVATLAADISGKTPTTLHGVTNAVTDSLLEPVYRMPYVGNLIDKESKTDKLYDAILKDKSHAERMRGTYKDDVAYESALKTALKENDPRVQQAADARYAGDIDVYDDIVNEIVADGKFDKRIVVGAVNSAYNAMNKTDTARTPDEKAVSIYTSEMVGEAFKLGDEETALKAVEDLIGVKMENGADEKKARSSVKTSVTKVMKPLYLEAYKNGDGKEMARIKQFLEDTGLYGNSAKSSLDGWEKEYNSEHGKPETQTKSHGSQYKFNIPEVKVPEVKVPKIEVPKFNFNFK